MNAILHKVAGALAPATLDFFSYRRPAATLVLRVDNQVRLARVAAIGAPEFLLVDSVVICFTHHPQAAVACRCSLTRAIHGIGDQFSRSCDFVRSVETSDAKSLGALVRSISGFRFTFCGDIIQCCAQMLPKSRCCCKFSGCNVDACHTLLKRRYRSTFARTVKGSCGCTSLQIRRRTTPNDCNSKSRLRRRRDRAWTSSSELATNGRQKR